MRTFTVVPSFEGESAFFELPDIGFQGDHLSFAILFNLNELVEHWANIVPSMIVTDSKNNTFIAPYTSWNAETHIFTWNISSTETTYDGYLRCQLKCTSADDPEVIVCMSRICQTRVYESLEAAEDPPEAFQSWIDSLVQLGAEISADADVALRAMDTTATNARSAQAAADASEVSKNAAEAARVTVEQLTQRAENAQILASQARIRAEAAAAESETAKQVTVEAKDAAAQTLEEIDLVADAVATNASNAADSAQQAGVSMQGAITARNEAAAARDSSVAAKSAAETAQSRAEMAEEGAVAANYTAGRARSAAEAAQQTAEDAQNAAEAAQSDAENARDSSENFSEQSKKWAVGKDRNNNDVSVSDETYQNNSKYWSDSSSESASRAEAAKDIILRCNVSTVTYSSSDESITFRLGGASVVGSQGA